MHLQKMYMLYFCYGYYYNGFCLATLELYVFMRRL